MRRFCNICSLMVTQALSDEFGGNVVLGEKKGGALESSVE